MKNELKGGARDGGASNACTGRLLPAVWLAAGLAFYAFSATAQLTHLSNYSHIIGEVQGAYHYTDPAPPPLFATNITYNGNADFTTSESWSVPGQTASPDQSTHIQGFHYYGTGAVTVSASGGDPNDPNYELGTAVATAESIFEATGHASERVRFHLSAQLTRIGGDNGYAPFLRLWRGGTALAQLDDAGSIDISGILRPGDGDFDLVAGATISVVNSGTASSSFTFDLQFYSLPAGDNEILGGLLSGGDMRFAYLGIAGTNYVLDRTFNLSPPVNWVPQVTNGADADGVLLFTNTPNKATNNFWRIRSVP